MTAISPRNPNLCLSCEQLVEDNSTELERLLAAAEHPQSPGQLAAGSGADEFSPGAAKYAHSSSEQALEYSVFVAPA
jgi:hypothetical protein